jgi:hypothetical protein
VRSPAGLLHQAGVMVAVAFALVAVVSPAVAVAYSVVSVTSRLLSPSWFLCTRWPPQLFQ